MKKETNNRNFGIKVEEKKSSLFQTLITNPIQSLISKVTGKIEENKIKQIDYNTQDFSQAISERAKIPNNLHSKIMQFENSSDEEEDKLELCNNHTATNKNTTQINNRNLSIIQESEYISKLQSRAKEQKATVTIINFKQRRPIENENDEIIANLKYEIINKNNFTSDKINLAKRLIDQENLQILQNAGDNLTKEEKMKLLQMKFDPERVIQHRQKKGIIENRKSNSTSTFIMSGNNTTNNLPSSQASTSSKNSSNKKNNESINKTNGMSSSNFQVNNFSNRNLNYAGKKRNYNDMQVLNENGSLRDELRIANDRIRFLERENRDIKLIAYRNVKESSICDKKVKQKSVAVNETQIITVDTANSFTLTFSQQSQKQKHDTKIPTPQFSLISVKKSEVLNKVEEIIINANYENVASYLHKNNEEKIIIRGNKDDKSNSTIIGSSFSTENNLNNIINEENKKEDANSLIDQYVSNNRQQFSNPSISSVSKQSVNINSNHNLASSTSKNSISINSAKKPSSKTLNESTINSKCVVNDNIKSSYFLLSSNLKGINPNEKESDSVGNKNLINQNNNSSASKLNNLGSINKSYLNNHIQTIPEEKNQIEAEKFENVSFNIPNQNNLLNSGELYKKKEENCEQKKIVDISVSNQILNNNNDHLDNQNYNQTEIKNSSFKIDHKTNAFSDATNSTSISSNANNNNQIINNGAEMQNNISIEKSTYSCFNKSNPFISNKFTEVPSRLDPLNNNFSLTINKNESLPTHNLLNNHNLENNNSNTSNIIIKSEDKTLQNLLVNNDNPFLKNRNFNNHPLIGTNLNIINPNPTNINQIGNLNNGNTYVNKVNQTNAFNINSGNNLPNISFPIQNNNFSNNVTHNQFPFNNQFAATNMETNVIINTIPTDKPINNNLILPAFSTIQTSPSSNNSEFTFCNKAITGGNYNQSNQYNQTFNNPFNQCQFNTNLMNDGKMSVEKQTLYQSYKPPFNQGFNNNNNNNLLNNNSGVGLNSTIQSPLENNPFSLKNNPNINQNQTNSRINSLNQINTIISNIPQVNNIGFPNNTFNSQSSTTLNNSNNKFVLNLNQQTNQSQISQQNLLNMNPFPANKNQPSKISNPFLTVASHKNNNNNQSLGLFEEHTTTNRRAYNKK